jgi:hypothetical protein
MGFISNVETEFSKAVAWFKKVFKKLPAWNVAAATAINLSAPILESLIAVFDPAVAPLVDPIIGRVQSDFAAISSLVAKGDVTNLPTFINAVKADLPTLLTVGQITDPATVTKVTLATNTIIAELEAVLAAIPAVQAATA